MNIVVYCGSSDSVDEHYLEDARAVGEWIGRNGHTLVWGGCRTGLMGAVADSAKANGAKLVGVLPNIPRIQQRRYMEIDEVVESETLGERKDIMISLGDAFIALAGGPGTLDEASDIVSLAKASGALGPCVFFDSSDFYQHLREFFVDMVYRGFVKPEELESVLFTEDIDELIEFVEK